MHRFWVVVASTMALICTLTACSSGSDDSDTSSDRTVVVEHQYGSTTVPVAPKRVITIGGAWADSIIRIGEPITAEFVAEGYSGKDNRFAWTPEHKSTVVSYDSMKGIPETAQLAKFTPDLILAGYIPDRETYDRLAAIAPTVGVMAKATITDSWRDVMSTVGKIYDKQKQADEAIAEVDKQIASVKAKYPASQGKTASFGQLTPQKQFGVITSDTDPAAKLLAEFGLVLDPAVKSLSSNGDRVLVSSERIDLLRSDLLIFWPLAGGPETFEAIPGWNNLPAVRSGATVYLTNDNASAFSAPSIYSVPWAVEKLTPALAKL